MTVFELIEKLKTMPQYLDVRYCWDGDDRTLVEEVFIAKTHMWIGEGVKHKVNTTAVMLLGGNEYLDNQKEREIKTAPTPKD